MDRCTRWSDRGPRHTSQQLRALIRLALEFRTWELLAGQGMTDPDIARLLKRAIAGDDGPERQVPMNQQGGLLTSAVERTPNCRGTGAVRPPDSHADRS